MSTLKITGMREYNFKDDNVREVKGMSVYYAQELKDSTDGARARGFTTGKLNIKTGTELYTRMFQADYSKPFDAEVVFDIIPPAKNPVLTDIRPIKQ